jgi:epoxyqueuosine reductase
MDRLRLLAPQFQGRAFVDSAPVAERSLAASAGLGWIGRNGCLISPGLGSYVLLCEIICNLPLRPDTPIEPGCGDCDACIRACPSGAQLGDGVVDARKCLSYLTMEPHGRSPQDLWSKLGGRVFGCDACQEVCPHNRLLPAGDPDLIGEGPPLGGAGLAEILAWDEAAWDCATRGSATRRAGLQMLLRNAVIAAGAGGQATLAQPLRNLRGRAPELVAEIDWALSRLAGGGKLI